MIERYSTKEIAEIWSDDNKYRIWLEVETLALEAMAKEGLVPESAVKDVREKGKFETKKILEIEEEVKHDVIAFLTNVAEHVGPSSRYVHRGMTSNDLLDTTFAVQLKASGEIILKSLDSLIESIKKRAEEFKYTPCVGRSHGIHAEPITFGLKLLSWYSELLRQKTRFKASLKSVSVGKLAGAVGTYASLSPDIEKYVFDKLGIDAEHVPTQIVSRDRHAEFFSVLAQIGSSIERFAVEVRHLQRTEVNEASESFSKGQKGSSAMPHKKNPILSENVTGLARLLRSYSLTALENVPLWHERDISHSSAERVIAPDSCNLAHFMIERFNKIISNLDVNAEKMLSNLNLTKGLIFSGSLLLSLVDKGVLREDAYKMVQAAAMSAMESGAEFKAVAINDKEILNNLSSEEVASVFDLDRYFKHVDFIFNRAINEG